MELMTMLEGNKLKDREPKPALNSWASSNFMNGIYLIA